MPTQATVDRWKRRAEDAERWLDSQHRRADQAEADADKLRAELTEANAELLGMDPEARLLADLQHAVEVYQLRCDAAAEAKRRERAGMPDYGYAQQLVAHDRTQPYRPALDSPLGRVLLAVAARHDVDIEPTTVYPDARPEQALVSVPRPLAEQLANMPYEAWR